jgi:hypothetical protein
MGRAARVAVASDVSPDRGGVEVEVDDELRPVCHTVESCRPRGLFASVRVPEIWASGPYFLFPRVIVAASVGLSNTVGWYLGMTVSQGHVVLSSRSWRRGTELVGQIRETGGRHAFRNEPELRRDTQRRLRSISPATKPRSYVEPSSTSTARGSLSPASPAPTARPKPKARSALHPSTATGGTRPAPVFEGQFTSRRVGICARLKQMLFELMSGFDPELAERFA